MGLSTFFDNFFSGLAFGMLANNPFFGCMGCYAFGSGYSMNRVDFETFANPFPNIFGNVQYNNTPSVSIMNTFANPTFPTVDFSRIGQSIWDDTVGPDSEFSKRMKEYFSNSNQYCDCQTNTYNNASIYPYSMPFSPYFFSDTYNPYMTYGFQPAASATVTSDKTNTESLKDDKQKTKNISVTTKVDNSETSSYTNTSKVLKGKKWYEMTDNELKQIYGNYSYDITKPYTGSEENLNSFLKGKGVLEGKAKAFLDAQKKYGISAAALAAITTHESGNGKSNLAINKNNVGGVRISGSTTFRTFNNVEECIMYMAKLLRNSYVDNPPEKPGAHLKMLYQINARYCPASDPTDRTNENSSWARAVANNMSIIEKMS